MSLSYGAKIVKDNLILCLDAANRASYSGSGTTWTDILGANFDLNPTITYSTASNGTFVLNGGYFKSSVRHTASEFQYNSPFTVEVVAYTQENTATGYYVGNRTTDGNSTAYSGWGINQDNGNFGGYVGGYPSGLYSWRRTTMSVADFNSYVYNKWAHIVFANSQTTGQGKIYINGIDRTQASSDDTTPPYTINYNSNYRLTIGADLQGTIHPLSSNISIVRIYNKTFSQLEVQRNFSAIRGRFGI